MFSTEMWEFLIIDANFSCIIKAEMDIAIYYIKINHKLWWLKSFFLKWLSSFLLLCNFEKIYYLVKPDNEIEKTIYKASGRKES